MLPTDILQPEHLQLLRATNNRLQVVDKCASFTLTRIFKIYGAQVEIFEIVAALEDEFSQDEVHVRVKFNLVPAQV